MKQEIYNGILNYLPTEEILAALAAAPGNEIGSGKFLSPESSAALAANTFGLFIGGRAGDLPPLPGTEAMGWPATGVTLEGIVRFPWRGGRHPCLDALVETGSALIGVESKRFEPFRSKAKPQLSEAYLRPCWGETMQGYERVRDLLMSNTAPFTSLDAAQLVKHAFGLRSEAERRRLKGDPRSPVLFYLYAEPSQWSSGKPIEPAAHETHRQDIALFAEMVAGDEVLFLSCSYDQLLAAWRSSSSQIIRDHTDAVTLNFNP
jgi:hypothetical protein